MKKLILIFALAAFAFTAKAQTTTVVTASPIEITAPDDQVNIIDLPKGSWIDFVVYFPEANSGTIQINTWGTSMSLAPVMSYATNPNGILLKARDKIWYKASATGQKIWIVIWP